MHVLTRVPGPPTGVTRLGIPASPRMTAAWSLLIRQPAGPIGVYWYLFSNNCDTLLRSEFHVDVFANVVLVVDIYRQTHPLIDGVKVPRRRAARGRVQLRSLLNLVELPDLCCSMIVVGQSQRRITRHSQRVVCAKARRT